MARVSFSLRSAAGADPERIRISEAAGVRSAPEWKLNEALFRPRNPRLFFLCEGSRTRYLSALQPCAGRSNVGKPHPSKRLLPGLMRCLWCCRGSARTEDESISHSCASSPCAATPKQAPGFASRSKGHSRKDGHRDMLRDLFDDESPSSGVSTNETRYSGEMLPQRDPPVSPFA